MLKSVIVNIDYGESLEDVPLGEIGYVDDFYVCDYANI